MRLARHITTRRGVGRALHGDGGRRQFAARREEGGAGGLEQSRQDGGFAVASRTGLVVCYRVLQGLCWKRKRGFLFLNPCKKVSFGFRNLVRLYRYQLAGDAPLTAAALERAGEEGTNFAWGVFL